MGATWTIYSTLNPFYLNYHYPADNSIPELLFVVLILHYGIEFTLPACLFTQAVFRMAKLDRVTVGPPLQCQANSRD